MEVYLVKDLFWFSQIYLILIESKNNSGWKGPSRLHLVQPHAWNRSCYSSLLRALSSRVLKMPKDWHCTVSLNNFFQYLTAVTVKILFLITHWHFLCCNLCPLPPTPLLHIPEKTLALLCTLLSGSWRQQQDPSFLWAQSFKIYLFTWKTSLETFKRRNCGVLKNILWLWNIVEG